MGKYTNRGVLDAYAGVSRGAEQWTVRSSRKLRARRRPPRDRSDPLRGPRAAARRALLVGAERRVADQLRVDVHRRGAVRARAARAPPQSRRAAARRRHRPLPPDRDRPKAGSTSTATRHELADETSVSTRDHSWGVRYMVGAPVDDVEEAPRPTSVLDHRDLVAGSHGAPGRQPATRIHTYYQRHGIGGWQRIELQGGIEHPDGRREPFAALVPTLEVRDDNRRLSAAELALHDGRRHRRGRSP